MCFKAVRANEPIMDNIYIEASGLLDWSLGKNTTFVARGTHEILKLKCNDCCSEYQRGTELNDLTFA